MEDIGIWLVLVVADYNLVGVALTVVGVTGFWVLSRVFLGPLKGGGDEFDNLPEWRKFIFLAPALIWALLLFFFADWWWQLGYIEMLTNG